MRNEAPGFERCGPGECARGSGCGRGEAAPACGSLLPHTGLAISMTLPEGRTATVLCRPEEASERGVGFVSGTEVRVGTRCFVQFVTGTGRRIRVPGEVRSCVRIGEGAYRTGVEFDRPVEETHAAAVRGAA